MVFWGRPMDDIWKIKDSNLELKCIRQKLEDDIRPMSFEVVLSDDNYVSFLGKRQTQINQTFACAMSFMPEGNESAGLALVQAMNHQLQIFRCIEGGKQVLKATVITADYEIPPFIPGFASTTNKNVIACVSYDKQDIVLQLKMQGEDFTVCYGENESDLTELCKVDGRIINPEIVGCMTGTLVGMFATGNGIDVDNWAKFDWFKMK